jgi:membrane protein DedA with SNARE-associated domain
MSHDALVAWITRIAEQHGYAGVALAMFFQGIIQVVPAYLVLPPVGYMAAQGKLDLALVIGSGFAGAMAANIILYQIGRYMSTLTFADDYQGENRYSQFAVNAYRRSRVWFDRYGANAVFWCRLVPVLRTMISVVAGVEKMERKPYLIITAAGTFIYTATLVLSGWTLKDGWQIIAEIQRPLIKLFLPFLALSFLWWLSVLAAERYSNLVNSSTYKRHDRE